MAWITPKTNWQGGQDGDKPTAADFNRIEGNIAVVREQSQLPLKYEVVSSFPAHAVGRVVFHTGNGRAYVSDGTNWIDISGRIGDALAAHVLEGKIFSSEAAGSGVTGTMPNRGAVVITPSAEQQAIAAGYHNGSGYVAGDADLTAGNIKKGIDIFGVVGAYPDTAQGTLLPRLYTVDGDTDMIYELDPDTFTVLNSRATPSGSPRGIGGILDKLYLTDYGTERLYSVNPDTLVTTIISSLPQSNPRGVGGIRDRLYYSDITSSPYRIHELHPGTGASLKYVSVSNANDVGGTDARLYCAKYGADELHELNPNTLASINSVTSPERHPGGMGGTYDRLYAGISRYVQDPVYVYELNPDTLAVINSSDPPGTSVDGIGGLKQSDGPMLVINSILESMQSPAAIDYLGDIYRK